MSPDDPTDPLEKQVRDLLAEARHDEPIPADVADRVDAALASLRREPVHAPAPATEPPADLGAARRRRHVRAFLLAAAVAVAIGIGIDQAHLDLSDDAADSGSADSSAAEAGGSQLETPSSLKAAGPPVVLSADGFGRQVRRLDRAGLIDGLSNGVQAHAPRSTSGNQSSADASANAHDVEDRALRGQHKAAYATCDPGGWGPGRRVKARYDGVPGVLLYRPAHGQTRVVELFLCGHDEPTRSITLPRR